MSLRRKIRFPFHAAIAVCAVALMIVANRGTNKRVLSSGSVMVRGESLAEPIMTVAEETAPSRVVAHKALLGTQAKASTTSVPVSQILPELGTQISDWRTYQPEKITIAPHADLALDFEMAAVRQENGRTIWRGRNALTGAFLVTVATENDWHAVLEIPTASSFEFHVTGQSATVTEKYETGACGAEANLADADLAQATVVLSPDPSSNTESTGGGSTFRGQAENVDVLFFYDSATLAANGGSHETIETALAARVESANLVLENSRVYKFRWHYVAAYRVPEYATTGKLENDLSMFTFTDNPTGKFVDEKCALHGVDQAVLCVTGTRDYAGIAWVPSGADSLAHFAAVVWDANYTVLAHELAHNFGCRHDRATEKAASDDASDSYGFRFELEGADVGTVMSYAPNRVPYFSNPELSYKGFKLGISEGLRGAADNARVLASKSSMMETHRDAALGPIISYEPESTKVTRGAAFSVNVSASGEGLTFQWRKDGSVIAGATSSSYSKTSCTDADAGSYDVVVSNGSGTVTSSAATVAVSSPAMESSSQAGQSQSGGGGGGAPSDWFFAALGLLAALRVACRKR